MSTQIRTREEKVHLMFHVCSIIRRSVIHKEILNLTAQLEKAIEIDADTIQSRYDSLAEIMVHFVNQGDIRLLDPCDIDLIKSLMTTINQPKPKGNVFR